MIARRFLILFVPLVALAASCGSSTASSASSGGSGSSAASTTSPTTQPVQVTTTISAAEQAVLNQITQRGQPNVTVPSAPATTLGITDNIVGTGDTVTAGSTVTVEYTGASQSTGKVFDSSWSRGGQPITFPLDQVIPGWTTGIVGMKVGGRRTLVIPGDQAYGANPPAGSGIAPNETLVFVIDLVATSPAGG